MKLNRRHLSALLSTLCLAIAMPASADVLSTIMTRKKIRVATDMGIAPFGMLDGSMKPTGSDVDVARSLAADWGVEIEFINTTGPTRIPNLNTDKADIVISSLSITEERAKVIDFTKPYSFIRTTVIGPAKDSSVKDWADLKGKSIAVVRTTMQDVELTPKAAALGFTVVRYDDDATAVTAAVSGQATYLGLGDPQMRTINQRAGGKPFEAKLVIKQFPIAMGVKKGETALQAKLNEWIAVNAKNGKLNAIYKKYHEIDVPAEFLK